MLVPARKTAPDSPAAPVAGVAGAAARVVLVFVAAQVVLEVQDSAPARKVVPMARP